MNFKPLSVYGRVQGGFAFKSKDFQSVGTPVLKIKNVKNGYVDYKEVQFVSDEISQKLDSFKTKAGDILISMTGSGPNAPASVVGRIAKVKKDEPIALINQRVGRILIYSENIISNRFLYYYLSQKKIQDFLVSNSTGSANQANISNALIESIEVPDLSYEEGCIISDKLAYLDDKIDNNNTINNLLQSISQTLFKSWFIDFEPIRAKITASVKGANPQVAAMQAISGKTADEIHNLSADNFKKLAAIADLFPDKLDDNEFGEIPKGWRWKPLYDTAEYVNGSAFKANVFSIDKTGLPIVKIAELKNGITPQTQFTNNAVQERYAIDNGSLLYSWSGSPETSLEVFKWFGGKGWLNQHIFLINSTSQAEKVFVFNLLTHLRPVLVDIAKNKQTTGLGHVTVADMKRVHIPYPDKKGLMAIQEYLNPLYEMDSNNTLQNVNLKQQRDTLLPKLMSGELEIN